jgi:hypothetical protein
MSSGFLLGGVHRRRRVAAAGGGGGLARIDLQGNADGTDGSGNLNITLNTVGADFVVVFGTIDSAGDISPTATIDGGSMGTGTEDGTTGQYQVMFTVVAPPSGAAIAIVVSTGLTSFDGTIFAASYSGVNQSTPMGTLDIVSTTGATSLSSGTVTCAAGNWIVSHLSDNGVDSTTSIGAETPTSVGGSGFGLGASFTEDRDGADDTIDWAWTGSQRASVLSFELKAA